MPAKSKRVRTGCLTCRERHLKCDEETPDCRNCRKSNRQCKRGIRLNFIDLTCKEPPYIPVTDDWTVSFQDESRLIASEYQGGLEKYARYDAQPVTWAHPDRGVSQKAQSQHVMEPSPRAPLIGHDPVPFYGERSLHHPDYLFRPDSYLHKGGNPSYDSHRPVIPARYENLLSNNFTPNDDIDTGFQPRHGHRSSDVSTAPSVAGTAGAGPSPTLKELGPRAEPDVDEVPESGGATVDNRKAGRREFLNSPEELYYMQVFVSEVALWMDSLDKEKHFSQLLPYHSLKCPMLLNAMLACGVKFLTLTQQYSDEKALFYYDTATTQLLRSLQNPERNTVECAVTAVVLNVYEIMSEKPTQRMSHIAGARALIRECRWNAKSTGLGAACFWLNVGMELLSCLAFNWPMSWGPDTWGVDMDFDTWREPGTEEIWVHRIFYIVAKIANFRATQPMFKELSPHDEQLLMQSRMIEWSHLKAMCKEWENACPRPMHPIGYVQPSRQTGRVKSLFPEIWLVKSVAVIGRLYYHMALCLLAQVNPSAPKDSVDAVTTQQHHAHQVCGIVAHNKDRGVASVSIRSLVVVAEVLTDYAEQREVVGILERIDRETGWKLGSIITELEKTWAGEQKEEPSSAATHLLGSLLSPGYDRPYQSHHSMARGKQPISRQLFTTASTTPPPRQMMLVPVIQIPAATTTTAPLQMHPQPVRVNPLNFADFNHPNHPYRNWYEPPSRSNSYTVQGLF
ncbi:hypothetical protein F5Y17DRAFT_152810 [Xylariaceae sp. FL0594]|nr:hypothetical protein F5Y17DRAFT_152810 [Xylariaceae sp. FL0594]